MSLVHPSWCARPVDEAGAEMHTSAPIACHGDGALVGIEVCLAQYWPPVPAVPHVLVTVVEDGEAEGYPLDLTQAEALRAALGDLLAEGAQR